MLRELVKLASDLDAKGFASEADELDRIIVSLSSLEDRNYFNDPRTRAAEGKWYDSFDSDKMEFTVSYYPDEEDFSEPELITIPATYQVCGLCRGKGTVVNPSIDASGIGHEDFEDEDFEEGYRTGRYDIPCPQCDGKRVEPVVSGSNLSPEQKAALDYVAEVEADINSDRQTMMGEMGW
jgi:hypothetical protein